MLSALRHSLLAEELVYKEGSSLEEKPVKIGLKIDELFGGNLPDTPGWSAISGAQEVRGAMEWSKVSVFVCKLYQ